MTEETTHFDELREDDYDNWEQDGKEMLNLLIKKKAELEQTLKVLEVKIAKLEKVFGDEKPKVSKPKIRPVLKTHLLALGPEGSVPINELVETVAKELSVKKDAVEGALKRWMSAEPELFVVEGGKIKLVQKQKKEQ